MAANAKDINGRNFGVGAQVSVRCSVVSITPTNAGALHAGDGDPIVVVVQTPGNVGERANVSFTISPAQCQVSNAPSVVNGN